MARQFPLPFKPDGTLDSERIKTDPPYLMPMTTRFAWSMIVAMTLVAAGTFAFTDPAKSAPWWSYLPSIALAAAVAWLAPNRWFSHRGRRGVPMVPATAWPLESWRLANSFAAFAVATVVAVGIVSGYLVNSPWPAVPTLALAVILQLTVCWPPRTWRRVQPRR